MKKTDNSIQYLCIYSVYLQNFNIFTRKSTKQMCYIWIVTFTPKYNCLCQHGLKQIAFGPLTHMLQSHVHILSESPKSLS